MWTLKIKIKCSDLRPACFWGRIHIFLRFISGSAFLRCETGTPTKMFFELKLLKVIRKFLLNHNKSFRWHLGDYKKHDFPFEGLCVCGVVRKMAGEGPARRRVVSLHSAYINRFLTGILHVRKSTQKSKFRLSQAFKWKKMMFFVIPEMQSKTFVTV